jgi:FixJ family two-component response regulator
MIAKEAAGLVHVVDDHPSFRTVMTRILSAAGLRVRTYASPTHIETARWNLRRVVAVNSPAPP